jgi:hypothetical protein
MTLPALGGIALVILASDGGAACAAQDQAAETVAGGVPVPAAGPEQAAPGRGPPWPMIVMAGATKNTRHFRGWLLFESAI